MAHRACGACCARKVLARLAPGGDLMEADLLERFGEAVAVLEIIADEGGASCPSCVHARALRGGAL
jgi:hypothetical protein